jgi:methylmalonyl-CoA carboxyltransferase 12S subunit
MPGKSSSNVEIDVEILLRRIEELEERIQRLEEERSLASKSDPGGAPPEKAPFSVEDGIPDETIAVITAAVAAFLGVRARIRHISLNGSDAWAQQGRVSIMASHRWAMHRS